VSDRQDEKESENQQFEARRQGAVYQGTLEAVIAILVAMGFGYWLDRHFDTAPTLLLVGTAIGFASFTVRMIRLGRRLQGESSSETGDAKDDE
jgi:F0F1-type ATP synthase assembly protein I